MTTWEQDRDENAAVVKQLAEDLGSVARDRAGWAERAAAAEREAASWESIACEATKRAEVAEGISAYLKGAPHQGENCPTEHDAVCNCTVETLAHNIKRAEAAEAWQVAVAEGLGFLNRAEGQAGYEIAAPEVIIASVTGERRELSEADDTFDRLSMELERAQAGAAALKEALKPRGHRPGCAYGRAPGFVCQCGYLSALATDAGAAMLERLRRAEAKATSVDCMRDEVKRIRLRNCGTCDRATPNECLTCARSATLVAERDEARARVSELEALRQRLAARDGVIREAERTLRERDGALAALDQARSALRQVTEAAQALQEAAGEQHPIPRRLHTSVLGAIESALDVLASRPTPRSAGGQCIDCGTEYAGSAIPDEWTCAGCNGLVRAKVSGRGPKGTP